MNNRFCNKFNIYYPLNTFFSAFLILLSVFFLISCQIPHQAPVTATAWVRTWGAAQQLVEPHNLPPIPGLNNNTLRQVVRVSIGGEQLRVRFSNEYSTSPVILKSVHIAASTGRSAIDPETDAALSFGGKKMTVIDPGATAISDPCHFLLKPRSDVAITVHFGATSPDVTGHPGSRTTSYLTTGDMVTAVTLPEAVMTDHWYMIDSIEVLASESARAIVVIGDSITDGRGSGTNKQNRWPDELARRLQEDLETSNISVLNMGIGGNCVLRDCLGSAAITRFKNDVLEQSGVKWLIILEGINDIGQAQGEANASDVANKLIAAYEQMIYHAHNNGILVYGATLLPFGGSFYDDIWRESARQTVNKWIRTSRRFDDVIDLDKAIGDPENPERMLPVADTGDHLHPNETGHKMMAAAVDLDLFKIKSGNKVSD